MKIRYSFILFLLGGTFLLTSCDKTPPTDLTKTPFIPKPVSVTATGDAFTIKSSTLIYVSDETEQAGKYLSGRLNEITGYYGYL